VISQVSSVSFLVYTLLVWSRGALRVGDVVPKPVDIRGVKVSLSLQCKWQFARSGQLSELHICSPLEMPPLLNAAQGECPFRPPPPAATGVHNNNMCYFEKLYLLGVNKESTNHGEWNDEQWADGQSDADVNGSTGQQVT